jgi:hypothetical protein
MRRKAEETERSFTEEGDLSSFRELKSLEKLVIWRFQYLKRSLPNFVSSSVAAEGVLISSCWRFGVTFFNSFSSSAGMIVLFCSFCSVSLEWIVLALFALKPFLFVRSRPGAFCFFSFEAQAFHKQVEHNLLLAYL